jgi:hypothetical protein
MATQNNIKVFGSKKTKKQIDKVSFEDTKGVIRIRIPKKTKLRNSQRKKVQKDKQRPTQHTHKTKGVFRIRI